MQSPLGYLYRELVLPHPPSSRRSQVVPLVGFEPTRREGTAFEAADYTIRLQGLVYLSATTHSSPLGILASAPGEVTCRWSKHRQGGGQMVRKMSPSELQVSSPERRGKETPLGGSTD